MEESTDNKGIKQFSARVFLSDHETVTKFLESFKTKAEGFSEFVKLVQKPVETKEVHQNLEQIFEYSEYSRFVTKEDTNILEPIKAGLKCANAFLEQNIEKLKEEAPKQNSVADFVPADLVAKVNLLHRRLLMKKQIPESTQGQYLEELLTYSLKYFLKNEYEEIYNH